MVDQLAEDRARIQREITEKGFRRLEVASRAEEAWKARRPTNIELAAPLNVRYTSRGPQRLQPNPELLAIGRLFWQARRRAGMSQQRLSYRCGVSQSMISRFERGLAPAMGVRHLIAMANALGRIFPFGTCPHEHECGWQPYRPPEAHTSYVTGWLDAMLAADSRPAPPHEAEIDVDGEPLISVTLADLSVTSEDGPAE